MGKGGLRADPVKLEAISQLKPPTTQRELRAFLGLVGYYRRLIKDFQKEGSVLNKLLRKDAEFVWSNRC